MTSSAARAALLAIAVLGAACGQEPSSLAVMEESAEPRMMRTAAAPSMESETGGQEPLVAAAQRKLIRTVELELVVEDPERAASGAAEIAEAHDGYVSDSNSWRDNGLMHHRLTLRIPTDELDQAVAALEELALRLERKSIGTQDVTDRYVDFDARLTNLRLTEQELQELLQESRSGRQAVEGVMAVYRELTEIRSQIDSLQGRLNLLDNRVALATVQLELTPDASLTRIADAGWRPALVVRNSLRTLLVVLQGLVDFGLFTAIVLLPTALVLWLIVWTPLRYLWRRRRSGRQKAKG